MDINERITALVSLGSRLNDFLSKEESSRNELFLRAKNKNPWFTEDNLQLAFQSWVEALTEASARKWLSNYNTQEISTRRVGVINAGNIPLVGLHDLLSVLMSGHNYKGKNATDDPYLLPFVSELLIEVVPQMRNRISFIDKLKDFDAVIATGSNNSARYFEYYFGKVPHIIRRNMNGAAVLSGKESKDELKLLGNDIFSYFGLGCRNVSKLYVPENYQFDLFFESIYDFHALMQHSKYMNNFDYNNAVLLLKQIPFLQNGFLILLENKIIASPLAILHYEKYSDYRALKGELEAEQEKIQCIVTSLPELKADSAFKGFVNGFGESQKPQLWDYADRADTMQFLVSLK